MTSTLIIRPPDSVSLEHSPNRRGCHEFRFSNFESLGLQVLLPVLAAILADPLRAGRGGDSEMLRVMNLNAGDRFCDSASLGAYACAGPSGAAIGGVKQGSSIATCPNLIPECGDRQELNAFGNVNLLERSPAVEGALNFATRGNVPEGGGMPGAKFRILAGGPHGTHRRRSPERNPCLSGRRGSNSRRRGGRGAVAATAPRSYDLDAPGYGVGYCLTSLGFTLGFHGVLGHLGWHGGRRRRRRWRWNSGGEVILLFVLVAARARGRGILSFHRNGRLGRCHECPLLAGLGGCELLILSQSCRGWQSFLEFSHRAGGLHRL